MSKYFNKAGLHVVVDGQFGSTGKGALSAYLAHKADEEGVRFIGVVSNAGPNSGHTSYVGDEKIVLKQLPSFAVVSYMLGNIVPIYLSAGAVIDIDTLIKEAAMVPNCPIFIHPQAAVIGLEDLEAENEGTIAAVAGTRKGVGAAIARKVQRDPMSVAKMFTKALSDIPNVNVADWSYKLADAAYSNPVFMEISQGFSLGINSEFFPKVTSRECTVMQGLTDARLPYNLVRKVYLSIRSYPIRVGNYEGYSSGDCYDDQREIHWEDIDVEPEVTTVTGRKRRLFTFSSDQLQQAIMANQPTHVFINFLNYAKSIEEMNELINTVRHCIDVSSMNGEITLLGGYGPFIGDVSEIVT